MLRSSVLFVLLSKGIRKERVPKRLALVCLCPVLFLPVSPVVCCPDTVGLFGAGLVLLLPTTTLSAVGSGLGGVGLGSGKGGGDGLLPKHIISYLLDFIALLAAAAFCAVDAGLGPLETPDLSLALLSFLFTAPRRPPLLDSLSSTAARLGST